MSAGQPFRVLYSGSARELVEGLLTQARSLGIGERVARSLREVEGHLELDPREWGDPIRHLVHAKITAYRRIHADLCVEYGVHDAQPYVWILLIEPVLGHPLCQPDDGL